MDNVYNLIIIHLFVTQIQCYNSITSDSILLPKIVQLSEVNNNERMKRSDYWGDNVSWNDNQEKIYADDGNEKVSIWENSTPDRSYFSSPLSESSPQTSQSKSSWTNNSPSRLSQTSQSKSSWKNNSPSISYNSPSYSQRKPQNYGYYYSSPSSYYNQPVRRFFNQPSSYYNQPSQYNGYAGSYYNQPYGYSSQPIYQRQPNYYYPAYKPAVATPADVVQNVIQR